ncbi:prepilin peptidase [Candidatus Magnetaquicoccus inordinatus]|uniref:prepilin peptidase n=1 Tax=Candidatus Magnetaquicoccus inordinatus TaxID=2496818 RepID=UPI00102CFC31|nr:A24 family peptidase [Candidatus Magnetaquicoccus inordinatus]
MPWEYTALLLLYGSIIGSFLNVCIYRLPREISLVRPRSSCPHCQKIIAWYDNIPLLSWLFLRGRCRNCQQSISPLYPLVELASALLVWHTVWHFGWNGRTALLLLLGFAFLVLMLIDFYHYILPDVITLPGIVLGVVAAASPLSIPPLATLENSLLGLLCGGGGLWMFVWFFEKITGKKGMGAGDIKLYAMIGTWLGWHSLPLTLFLASLLGSVVGILWMLFTQRDRSQPIPFGPYLIIAAWVYLLYGKEIYRWYLT